MNRSFIKSPIVLINRIKLFYFLCVFAFLIDCNEKRFSLGGKAYNEPIKSKEHVFRKAAVATDNPICSKIGLEIIKSNGNAIDSLLAVLLCLGVVHPHSSGLGGGGFMLLKMAHKNAVVVNFREEAPVCSYVDMMRSNKNLANEGGLSVAIPGELKTIIQLWKSFGTLSLDQIIRPSYILAKYGFHVSKSLRIALEKNQHIIDNDRILKEIFKENDQLALSGQIIKNRRLADFLHSISVNFVNNTNFFQEIHQIMADEINKQGGCITTDDLNSYRAHFEDPIEIGFGNLRIISPSAPSSGPVLILILNILKHLNVNKHMYRHNRQLFYHFLIESFKFGYAYRTYLSDPQFEYESHLTINKIIKDEFAKEIAKKIDPSRTFGQQHYRPKSPLEIKTGTTHITIIDQDNNVVSVTSTINGLFGAKFASKYGFIYNNEMDDFSFPGITNQFNLKPTEVNFVSPKKRPQSSAAPTIIVDQVGNPLMVIGASGGSFITSAIAQVIVYHVFLGFPLIKAIDEPRLHCQLFPDKVYLELQFNRRYGSILKSFRHKIEYGDDFHAVVQAISKFPNDDKNVKKKNDVNNDGSAFIYAESDYRKGGISFGI